MPRYNVDRDTVGEIQSVTFGQVVHDLQVCAVQPLSGVRDDDSVASGLASKETTSESGRQGHPLSVVGTRGAEG